MKDVSRDEHVDGERKKNRSVRSCKEKHVVEVTTDVT